MPSGGLKKYGPGSNSGSPVRPNRGDKRPFVDPRLVSEQRKMVRALRRHFIAQPGYSVTSTEILAVCASVTGRSPEYHHRGLARVMKAAFPQSARRRTSKGVPNQRRVWTGIRRKTRRPPYSS